MDPRILLAAVLIGLGATLLIDVWALVLKRAFHVASLDYCLLGRWVLHFSHGTIQHASIGAASRRRHECPVGWIAHYLIGTGLALAFVIVMSENWLAQPTLWPALVFGIGTVLIPFLTLQPAFGLGIAASKTPSPARARLKSVMTHTVFGVGLYLGALGLSRVWFRA